MLASQPRTCSLGRVAAEKTSSAYPGAVPLGIAGLPPPVRVRWSATLAPNAPGGIDVVELDAASHGGVDDTRELGPRVMRRSSHGTGYLSSTSAHGDHRVQRCSKIVETARTPDLHDHTTEPEEDAPTDGRALITTPFRLLPPRTMRGRCSRICEQEERRASTMRCTRW